MDAKRKCHISIIPMLLLYTHYQENKRENVRSMEKQESQYIIKRKNFNRSRPTDDSDVGINI